MDVPCGLRYWTEVVAGVQDTPLYLHLESGRMKKFLKDLIDDPVTIPFGRPPCKNGADSFFLRDNLLYVLHSRHKFQEGLEVDHFDIRGSRDELVKLAGENNLPVAEPYEFHDHLLPGKDFEVAQER